MTGLRGCAREQELMAAMRSGHWPAASPEELRIHVDGCRTCGDLVRVKAALLDLRVRDMASARLEMPGVILWRAQLRRRHAALQRAARPVEQACVFALGTLLLLLLGLGILELRPGADWVSGAAATWATGEGLLSILAMAGAVAMLSGLAAYLAAGRE